MANETFYYIKVEGPIKSVLEDLQRVFGGVVTTELDRIGHEHPVLKVSCEHSSKHQVELHHTISNFIYRNFRSYYSHWKVLGYMTGSRPYEEPEPITLYVHEPRKFNGRSIIQVTRLRKDWRQPRSRKQVLDLEFSIDEPGTWFDDEYNCHVDGCDHACKTLHEAISKGIWVLRSRDLKTGVFPRYEIKAVATPYLFDHIEPDYYHLEQAESMTVDYQGYIADWQEEDLHIEQKYNLEAV